MMAGDLRDRDPFVGRLREAYARAARSPAVDRRVDARAAGLVDADTSRSSSDAPCRRTTAARLLRYRRRAA